MPRGKVAEVFRDFSGCECEFTLRRRCGPGLPVRARLLLYGTFLLREESAEDIPTVIPRMDCSWRYTSAEGGSRPANRKTYSSVRLSGGTCRRAPVLHPSRLPAWRSAPISDAPRPNSFWDFGAERRSSVAGPSLTDVAEPLHLCEIKGQPVCPSRAAILPHALGDVRIPGEVELKNSSSKSPSGLELRIQREDLCRQVEGVGRKI